MLNFVQLSEILGLVPQEVIEIKRHQGRLLKQKEGFLKALSDWQKEFNISDSGSQFLVDGYYEALVSGHYQEEFYIVQYHQTLHWIACDFSQSRIMLAMSYFRKFFISYAEAHGDANLAKGLCHVLDLGQSVMSTIYSLIDAVDRMKTRSLAEVNRIQKSYQLISEEVPPALLQAYLDHQQWKQVVFNLSLGRSVNIDDFELCHRDCRLSHWLGQGGLELIPEAFRDEFLAAHERVHQFGEMAISDAEVQPPERILRFLDDMEKASDTVSSVLLDVIEEEFIRIATADGLTGLPNRRSFEMEFEKNIAFAKRHHFWVGLVMIDIDHFKEINDAYGHAVGDQVLKLMAQILCRVARTEEKIYRWGGEEFALLTLDKESGGAEKLAERVRLAVEKHVFQAGDIRLNWTVSCGSICFSESNTLPRHEIFAMADKQLYKAKQNGRNQVQHRNIEPEC